MSDETVDEPGLEPENQYPEIDINREMEQSFIDYAMSVIVSRA